MKKLLLVFFCITLITSTKGQGKQEKINLSYWYVFGRFPSQAEFNYWNGQSEQSLSSYVINHKNYMSSDNGSKTQTIITSYKNAFGRSPSDAELKYWKSYNQSYSELMNGHVQYLIADPNENKNVINRAYNSVFNRDPKPDELSVWQQSNFPYYLLRSCLNSYKNSYRVQSVEAVMNFVKQAWETTTSFTVNAANNIYQASTSAWINTTNSIQKMISVNVPSKTVNELIGLDGGTVSAINAENGGTLYLPGAKYIKNASRLIGLDGANIIGQNGSGVIGPHTSGIVLHPPCDGCPTY